MKILHVCETAKGGVGTYINTLAEMEFGVCETRVVLPDAHQGMIASRIKRRPFSYPHRSARSMINLVAAAVQERFRYKPDVVFCHSTFALLPLVFLRLVSPRTKFIFCAHGWAGAREMQGAVKARVVRLVEGTLCGLAHRVVNVSRGDLRHAKGHSYSGHHVVIENAVAPPTPQTKPLHLNGSEDSIHLLFVGRLDHQKGLDILLLAYAQARKINPALQLHIIGEAVVSADTPTGTAENMPTTGVNFLGWVFAENIDSYYAAADLVVLPSRWEGLPLVVPEALRNGTPVLVSDRSDMPSLIDAGTTGYSAQLDVAQFAAALAALRKDTLTAMRPACLAQFNKRYRADRLGSEIMSLYKELMGI